MRMSGIWDSGSRAHNLPGCFSIFCWDGGGQRGALMEIAVITYVILVPCIFWGANHFSAYEHTQPFIKRIYSIGKIWIQFSL